MKEVYLVAFVAFPNVEELDLVGAWQVLATTQHFSNETYFLPHTVGLASETVKCAHGLTIKTDRKLGDMSKYDIIVVPGGPGVNDAAKDKRLLQEIQKAYQNGKMVCSVCTGAFVLAEAGVLKGKKATTFHTELNKLSSYGAIPVKERVVVEGNILTGAGVSASLDVGLKIVEILLGKQTAAKVAKRIEYPT